MTNTYYWAVDFEEYWDGERTAMFKSLDEAQKFYEVCKICKCCIALAKPVPYFPVNDIDVANARNNVQDNWFLWIAFSEHGYLPKDLIAE